MPSSKNKQRDSGNASAAAVLLAAGCSDGANENHKEDKEKSLMEFTELIEVRRSVRRYAKSEIAKDEMEKIVADALNAPSWKNSETTRYYAAIGDEAKARISAFRQARRLCRSSPSARPPSSPSRFPASPSPKS